MIYVDGLPDRSFTYNRPTSTFTSVSIGAIARAAQTHWFNAAMDEIMIWERALSAEDVGQIYEFQPRPTTTFAITGPELLNGNQMGLSVATSLGAANYRVQSTTDLAVNFWLPVDEATISTPANGVLSVVVPFSPNGKRFYRIIVGL